MEPIAQETPAPDKNKVTFLVDIGASDTCVNDHLIPGVRDILKNYERLNIQYSSKVVGAGENKLRANPQRIL